MASHLIESPPAEPRLADGRARLDRTRLEVALGISLIAVLVGYPQVLPMFREELQRYLSIGDAQFGLLFSFGPAAGCVMGLVGSVWVARWGARRVLRLTLGGLAVALALLGLAGSRWMVFGAGLALVGIFTGLFHLAMNVLLTQHYPDTRRTVLALNLAIIGAGGILLPLVAEAGLLLARGNSGVSFRAVMHAPFFLVGAMLVGAVWWLGRIPEPPPQPVSHTAGYWRHLCLPPPLALLAGLLAIHAAADTALYIWMARFLASGSFPATPVAPGVVLAGYSVAVLVARAVLTRLQEDRGRRWMLVLPGLSGGAVLVAGLVSRDFWLTCAGYLLGAACWSWENPAMLATAARVDPARFGHVFAVSQALAAVLMVALVSTTGLLADALGESRLWQAMLLPASGFLVVGLGGAAWLQWFSNPVSLRERAQ